MKNKVTYFLDFDRTLFDTDAFKQLQIERYGEVALGTLQSLEDIPVADFVFDDAFDFLSSHQQESLHIVSSCAGRSGGWDTAYQKKKLELSGISEWVSAVHVVFDQKIQKIRKLFEGGSAVFVDDMYRHLAAVQSAVPEVQLVHIARNGTASATDEKNYNGIPTIENLTELDAIIRI